MRKAVLRKAILRRYLFIIFLSLFLLSIISSYFINKEVVTKNNQNLLEALKLIDSTLDYSITNLQTQIEHIKSNISNKSIQISLIDKNEKVIADTTYSFRLNPKAQDDILNAIEDGYANSYEYDSNSITKKTLYVSYASKYSNNILRISYHYNAFEKNSPLTILLICIFFTHLFIFILTILIVLKFSRKITKPLNEISSQMIKIQNKNETPIFRYYTYDEFNDIVFCAKLLEEKVENVVSKLRLEKNKIEYILDNMGEGFVLFDENKKVFIINKAAKRILDCNDEDLGKNIVHYTQNITFINAIDALLSNKEPDIFDVETKDGQIYAVYISEVKKGTIDSTFKGGVALIVDVTTERRNQEIRQEFFSNISHELKTPITSIQGYAELLQNGFAKTPEQTEDFLKRIQKETANMTELINNILTISKLQNKMPDENISEINLNLIIEEIKSSLVPTCIERNITIEKDCDNIIINADVKKIHGLFNNLIVNAVKYNKDGGVVYISCKELDDIIEIIVKDSGIGIPLLDQSRIFERFYRVEKGRSKANGGTGLGLSIVKHTVNFYNGKINLKSKLNEGSTFIIKFPKDAFK